MRPPRALRGCSGVSPTTNTSLSSYVAEDRRESSNAIKVAPSTIPANVGKSHELVTANPPSEIAVTPNASTPTPPRPHNQPRASNIECRMSDQNDIWLSTFDLRLRTNRPA